MLKSALFLLLLPVIAFAADPQILSRGTVVHGQGYFPVALRLKDGRLAAVLRGGATHLGIHGRLDMVFSSDDGQTWSKPIVVADSPGDDRNPAFGQAADGTLVVAYWRTDNYDANDKWAPSLGKPTTTWVTRSSDGGQTWSPPAQIDTKDIGYGSPFGKMITAPDGTMLMDIYGKSIEPGAPASADASYIYRSTDNGQTWHRFATPGPTGFNETAILRLSNGKILAAMRSDSKQALWLTSSADQGKTWTSPKELTPPNIHPADFVILPDHRILLLAGQRTGPFGICAMIGTPDAQFDWNTHFTLAADAASRDCGYPSGILLPNQQILAVYYTVGTLPHPKDPAECHWVEFIPPAAPDAPQ